MDLPTLTMLSREAFLSLGADRMAYLKTIELDGMTGVAVYKADGTPIAAVQSIAAAQVLARRRDLEPVLVH